MRHHLSNVVFVSNRLFQSPCHNYVRQSPDATSILSRDKMKLLFAIPLFLAFFSSVVADIGQETSIANEGPEASGKIRASHQKPHAATLFLPEEELLDMDPTDVDFWEEPNIAETFTERVLRGLCGSGHRNCYWKHGCKYCRVCTCWNGCYWKKMSHSCGGRYSGDDKWYDDDDRSWGW